MNLIRIPLKMSNIYLIPNGGGYLQVDTGYDHDYPAYRTGLKQAGMEIGDIKYLFLTHHHDDHAGFLYELTIDAAVTIIANRLSKDLLLTGKNDKTRGGGWVSPMIRTFAEMKSVLTAIGRLRFRPFSCAIRISCWMGITAKFLEKSA